MIEVLQKLVKGADGFCENGLLQECVIEGGSGTREGRMSRRE